MKSAESIEDDIQLMRRFNDEYLYILLQKMKRGDICSAVFDDDRLFLDFDKTHQALLIGSDVKETVHLLCSQEFIRKNIIFTDKFKSYLDCLKKIDTRQFMAKKKSSVLWKVTHDVVNQMVYAATCLYNNRQYNMAGMTLSQAYKHTIDLEFDTELAKVNTRCHISGFLCDILTARTSFDPICAIQWSTKYAQNITELSNCLRKLRMKSYTQLKKHIQFYELSTRLINKQILQKGFGYFTWDFQGQILIFSRTPTKPIEIYGCNGKIIQIIYDPTQEHEQKQIISQIESKACHWCDSIYLSGSRFCKSYKRTEMYVCKNCKHAWYCSRRCQKFAWTWHKQDCIA